MAPIASSFIRAACLLAALCGAAIAPRLGAAQEDGAEPPVAVPPRSIPAAGDRIGEVGPEIFYLEDDDGRLVPVPGFRYRDFVELFRMQAGLPGAMQPPAAVLQRLVATIDLTAADPGKAALSPAVIACTVRQTRAGWVHVPIDLQGLLLSGTTRHDGPGRMVVDADPARGGYRLWFDHAPDKGSDATHEVVLEGRVAVDATADSQAVALRLPPATATVVELASARATPTVSVLPPVPPQRITTAATDAGSLTTIVGLAGDVRLRLSADRPADTGWSDVPEASVESLVRIDGRNAFIDATLRLANLPPALRSVRISLPPRTMLRGVRPPAADIGRSGTAERPVVEVAIDRDADGRATVELQCDRPLDPADAAPFEAIGFAVEQVETWRQWGRVSLVVEGEWRAEWSPGPGVRRVDPPASARRQGFVAAFAYDAQPAALPVRVKPRQSRVVIEPEYRYEVGATRIELAARLRVTASGGPATAITVAVDPAWAIDDVGPSGVVDVAAVTVERGSVTIPFTQAMTGDAVIEVRASRPIEREATALSWKLPVPQANLVAPAAVVIDAESDIEILPDVAASVGLVRQSAAGAPRAGSDSAALVYRLDLPQGTFAGTRRFLERRVDAAVFTRVDIDAADLFVTQAVRLDVVHVPLQFVELWVPQAVADSGTLEVRQGETPLDPFEAPEPSAEPPVGGSTARCLRAILVDPLLGTGELVVSYRLPMPAVPEEATVAVDLPLTIPAAARIGRQTVAVQAIDTLSIDVRGEAWRPEPRSEEGPRVWTTGKPQDLLPIAVAGRRRTDATGGVVEAAWLQTRLLADRREDVAVYVVAGSGGATTVSVPAPPGVADPSYAVRLDGATIEATSRKDGGLAVQLPPTADARPRVLEIRCAGVMPAARHAIARSIGAPARIRLEPPAFPTGVTQRRFYWEITARADEHVLAAPADWTSQQRWRWRPPAFQRLPVVSREALAAWIEETARGSGGQRPSLPVLEPGLVESRVVYSGVGQPTAATFWLVPTWCLVLAASGAALAAGLALAYVPRLRRTALVLPALAALLLAAAAAPDLAVVLGQAALPGLALTAVAWTLRGLLDRPEPAAAPAVPGNASPSSLTRALGGQPSLIVAGSSLRRDGSLTTVTKQVP